MNSESFAAELERVESLRASETAALRSELNSLKQVVRSQFASPAKIAFDRYYGVLGATAAWPSPFPEKGAMLMVDAGTTPNRVIALYLSSGDRMVEVFAKVI